MEHFRLVRLIACAVRGSREKGGFKDLVFLSTEKKSCQGHSEEDCEKRKFGDEGRDFVSGCAKFEISSRPPKEINELAV